jgi:hypothetical protein
MSEEIEWGVFLNFNHPIFGDEPDFVGNEDEVAAYLATLDEETLDTAMVLWRYVEA